MTRVGWIAAVLLVLPAQARALDFSGLWNPFRPPVERRAQQIDEARQRGELDLAQTLLDDAEAAHGKTQPLLLRQHGLLTRDRGRLAEAADLLGRAADLDPAGDARIEQAGVLVPLGRWPEAVEVLSRAFDERGAHLRADDVVADARFAPLVGFAPFQDLVRRIRAEQAGPLGRLMLEFQNIDDSVRTQREVTTVLSEWLRATGRLFDWPGTAVVVLLGLGLLLTFGVAQTGLARPPWTLVTGMLVGSGLWYLGARIATATADAGVVTISTSMAVVFVPWGAVLAVRALWRWRHRMDPLDSVHLPQTLALLDEVHRLSAAALAAPSADRGELVGELRRAAATLEQRLSGVVPVPPANAATDPVESTPPLMAPPDVSIVPVPMSRPLDATPIPPVGSSAEHPPPRPRKPRPVVR